jgi:hypothetical protein
MRHLPLVFALSLLSIPASVYAQDPHAGHVAPAAADTQAPARGLDLKALMSRIDQAAGEEKVTLMAALLSELVAAQIAQGGQGMGAHGMCGGDGHSCPMCQEHKAMMKKLQDPGASQAR